MCFTNHCQDNLYFNDVLTWRCATAHHPAPNASSRTPQCRSRRSKSGCGSAGARRRSGFIRIDSVHHGDLHGVKGLLHINAFDCVPQWDVVKTVWGLT